MPCHVAMPLAMPLAARLALRPAAACATGPLLHQVPPGVLTPCWQVLFCTNYEEALDLYDRYRDNCFGVITDLGFPKEGKHNPAAGLQLIAYIKEMQPELPVLMQTSQKEDSQCVPPDWRPQASRWLCIRHGPCLCHVVPGMRPRARPLEPSTFGSSRPIYCRSATPPELALLGAAWMVLRLSVAAVVRAPFSCAAAPTQLHGGGAPLRAVSVP